MNNQYSDLVLGTETLDVAMEKGKKIGSVLLNSIGYLIDNNRGVKIHNNKFIPLVDVYLSATLLGFSLTSFFQQIEEIVNLNENLTSINCSLNHILPALEEPKYYIYSIEHSGWWAKKKMGYVKQFCLDDCFFTKNLIKAEKILSDANKGQKHLKEILVTIIV